MRHLALTLSVFVTACGAFRDAPADAPARAHGAVRGVAVDSTAPGRGDGASAHAAAPPIPDSIRRPPVPLVPTPDPVRGLYVNRWAARGSRMWDLIEIAKRSEVNALVIDVKDDRGLVLYHSTVPLAREIGADTLQPLSYARVRAILDTMRAHDIYPIARIVVAKDPLLADRKREWAIRRKSDGTPWLDKNGRPWLDPTHPEVWKYAADLAAEAVRLGFSEI